MRHRSSIVLGGSHPARVALSATMLILSAGAFYILSLRLIGQLHSLRAKDFSRGGYYGLAVNQLTKANDYQAQDPGVWRELGKGYYKLGELRSVANEAFHLTAKAKNAYLQAFQLAPLDAETAYELARSEARLEELYEFLHPEHDENPYEPLPYFEKALHLRPNGVLYHYALTRYLHRQAMVEDLLWVVHSLARIFPSSYYHLRKEDFWSPPVRRAIEKGLQKAVTEGISPGDAHKALSFLLAEEKEWDSAIAHYQQFLRHQGPDRNAEGYIHLGCLHLKGGQLQEAEGSFMKGVDLSRSREQELEKIYFRYKEENLLKGFLKFCEDVRHRFVLSSGIDLLVARCEIDLEQYDCARRILEDLNEREPTAEGYYWLAQVAKREKDWDAMELAIQKATVLEPNNSHYHLAFSSALKRLGKLERADKEAGLAIHHSAQPPSWLFDHRAWVRWAKQDYRGALDDWRSAIACDSNRAVFYVRAAEACEKMGNWTASQSYYRKAIELEPDNRGYAKRYLELTSSEPVERMLP